MKKNFFLDLFLNNLERVCITAENKQIKFKRLLSFIFQINKFLIKNNLENEKIIIQLNNRFHTLIFYLAAIFSKTTICPLDPKLPMYRVNIIKKNINAKKIIKKISLKDYDFFETHSLNLENHKFLITFSSGTSGDPKGIIHSSCSVLGSAHSYSKLAKYSKETRILHCLPEFYMAGIVNTFISCFFSLSQIFITSSFDKKSVFSIWSDIFRHKINLIYLVPSIYSIITNFAHPKAANIIKKNKIKFLSTSNFLYPSIRKYFYKKFNTKIKSCYGITELGGPLTNEINANLQNDSVGKLIKGCKIKIKEINKKNFIFIKSDYMCESLLIAGKEKKIQLDKDGYYNSMDTGYIQNNNIFLTGREKDILKKGGEFVYLKDIENIIINLRFVKEVAAVGVRDDLTDEKLYLYVVLNLKKINKMIIYKILSVIEKKMYKTEKPSKLIFLKKMPKTASGKIIKKKLIETYASNKIREVIL